MATTVTTFQREKTGNLVFPTYTKWGVIENPELTGYLNDMETLGHNWNSDDVYAFDRFISNGKSNGWWNSIMVIFPLFGTEAECLRIPLVQKIGVTKFATLGGVSSYDVPNPNWEAVAEKTNGKVIGFTPESNRCMASPYTINDVLQALNINDGIVRGGYTVIAKPNQSVSQRYWGANTGNYYADGTECSYALGFNNFTSNPATRACLGRVLTGRSITPDPYTYLKVKIRDVPSRAGVIYGNINGITMDVADISITPAKAINLAVAQKLQFGIGGFPSTDSNGDFGTGMSASVGSITRWHSVDKGDMDDTMEYAYHSAIKELFSALGK